jgi:preprotein translocase subunit SecG
MLYFAIVTLHVIVCVILVLVVLLQSGKGADLAGAFGGGATQTAFGSRGPASFLSRMTTVAAIIFMITSVSLSMISGTRSESKSILETTGKQTSKPIEKKADVQPGTQKATPTQEDIKRVQEEYEAKVKQQQAAPAPAPVPAQANPAQEKKPVK